MLEERALRIRKQHIASFGYTWIRPAGYPKTMQGIREEEAEREEAANAAMEGDMDYMGETGFDGAVNPGEDEDQEGMERDLDDDIPEADETAGLVEDGEDALEEEDFDEEDEEALMERDLDDDVPEGFGFDDEESEDLDDEEDYENQSDIHEHMPSGSIEGGNDSMMERDLDAEVPEGDENALGEHQEWEHTDTDAEEDDEYSDDAGYGDDGSGFDLHTQPHQFSSRLSTAMVENSPPLPPAIMRQRETEAQRLFLERWSGGVGDEVEDSMAAFRSSGMSDRNLRIPRIRSRRRQSNISNQSSGNIT